MDSRVGFEGDQRGEGGSWDEYVAQVGVVVGSLVAAAVDSFRIGLYFGAGVLCAELLISSSWFVERLIQGKKEAPWNGGEGAVMTVPGFRDWLSCERVCVVGRASIGVQVGMNLRSH